MNIENFRSTINSLGVLSPNRYRLNINMLSREEIDMCVDITLPAENIQSFEYAMPGIGPVTKVPNRVLFENLILQFNVLGDNRPYSTFRRWSKMIYDENYRFNDMTSYEREVSVQEFNRQGNLVGTHRYFNAYPAIVAPKTKNSAPTNTPEIFTVTMNFETSDFTPA